MTSTPLASNVTQAELVTNVRYGYWYNLLCERLYARLDFVTNAVQLVGGSAAAFSALQGTPALTAAAGLVLAVVAAVALLVQPSVKAERHRRAKCDYMALEAKAWSMTDADLSDALSKVRMEAPTGFEVLAVPAYNATLNAIGETQSLIAETWANRLARILA